MLYTHRRRKKEANTHTEGKSNREGKKSVTPIPNVIALRNVRTFVIKKYKDSYLESVGSASGSNTMEECE